MNQSRFYVSVLLMTPDDRAIVFKMNSPTSTTDEFYWSTAYQLLKPSESPKEGAIGAVTALTKLTIPAKHFELVNVISKPREEFKCWMFKAAISNELLRKMQNVVDCQHRMEALTEIPHPQHWILNEYVECMLNTNGE